MAKKLIDQDEAARALGITLESLNSLRDRGKLYPKRDGGVWKYDQEDIERYQREMNEGSGLGQSWESISLDDISLEDNPDSVLLSEAELGESTTGKSTIIGRKRGDEEASDIRLAGDSDLKLKTESGTKPGLPTAPGSSDLNLLSSGDDAPLNLAGDSKISFTDDPAPSGNEASKAGSSGLFDDSEFNLEPLGSSLSGASDGGKSPTPHSSGSFKLDDDDLLGDSGSDKGRDKSGDTAKGAGSSLQLDDDDDELVLDGGHGSDITMSGADSGIMLVDPADSGLSLDSPMTLGGGGDELTIGEDDMITLEEQVDVEGATQLRTSEDFSLTPTMGGDDDSDSGSQVIALDSEDDMSGAGMFGSASGDSLLSEDSGFGVPMDGGMGGVGLAGSPVAMQVAAYPEAPYSVWNVVGLICCTLLLMTGGIMVYDLTMQIWSWGTPRNYNSAIMDSLLKMFEA